MANNLEALLREHQNRLKNEILAIDQALRALKKSHGSRRRQARVTEQPASKKRRRRKLSAAQRAAISLRMKRRWAAARTAGKRRL